MNGTLLTPSPPAGEGGARREAVGGRGGAALLGLAKRMRSNATEAERKLWSILRSKRLAGFKFKRQQAIGFYIADFVNFERRLIVEADGSQHIDSARDTQRTAWLESQGFTVVRFWNDDILARADVVAEAIWAALQPPLPTPSPARREGLKVTHHG